MIVLLVGLPFASAWGLFSYHVAKRWLNPVMLRCSACGSKLTKRPSTRAGWIAVQVTWWITAWAVVWRLNISTGWALVMIALLLVPFNLAEVRVRFAIWRWRHPLRCGGGELEPVVSRL